ncbi:RICIN domain-containing protein [Lentzea alba]|uniref:RICIN domain-containing protein n=1 Tax=Lentzea alba TaxID=2714351 RepID=UPI0039BF1A28
MKMFSVLGAASLAVVAAVGVAQPASAAVTWKFQGSGTSNCLDGYVGHREGDVYHTGCNGGAFQNFRWVGSFGRQTQLVSNQSNKCAWEEGDRVGLATCNGSPSQVWVVSGSASRLTIRTHRTGKCLARVGLVNVRLETCDSRLPNQFWFRRS